MDRREKVELFEQIRREYERREGMIIGVATKLGVHRRMVRKALAGAVPEERKKGIREKPSLRPAFAAFERSLSEIVVLRGFLDGFGGFFGQFERMLVVSQCEAGKQDIYDEDLRHPGKE